MNYGIGLDCGIASVGFAVFELNEKDEPCRIIRLGSRVFDKAEGSDGGSLATKRRGFRSARRLTRRHKHRLDRIRKLLIDYKIISRDELDELFSGKSDDIYMLRAKSLDEPVNNKEFARILINLAQRRGFKSNRKSDLSSNDDKKFLSMLNENSELCKNYRTVGEMFYKDEKYAEHKRNKGKSHLCTVYRSMIEEEIKKIFESQRSFGMSFATEEIQKAYEDIALSQRPFDLGPGKGPKNSPSPYSGNQIEKMIGKCTFIKDEKRVPKASFSFQLFSLLQAINSIKISDFSSSKSLDEQQRKTIYDLCIKTKSVNYFKIREKLNLSEEFIFSNLSYGNKNVEDVKKKTKFQYLNCYHQIKSAVAKFDKKYFDTMSRGQLNDIGYAFTVYKTDDEINDYLKNKGFEEKLVDCLIENLGTFTGFGHLCVKACDRIIEHLEKGLTYDKACAEAGFDFNQSKIKAENSFLPANSQELSEITNPVVRRSVSQTIKVINAIIREESKNSDDVNSPTYINIELSHELKKNYKERKELEKSINENQQRNDEIKNRLEEEFEIKNPKGG